MGDCAVDAGLGIAGVVDASITGSGTACGNGVIVLAGMELGASKDGTWAAFCVV